MAHDFTKFHSLKPEKLLEALNEMLTHDIAKLMPLLRQEELETDVGVQGAPGHPHGSLCGGGDDEALEDGGGLGMTAPEWVVTKDKSKYDEIFYNLAPAGNVLQAAPRSRPGWWAPSSPTRAGSHLEAERC